MASYKIIRDNKVKKIKNANKGLWNGEKKIINTLYQLTFNKKKLVNKKY